MVDQNSGVDAIRNQLENVNFPASKNELVTQIGEKKVNLGGRDVNLREVINRTSKDRFNSKDELVNELKNMPEFKGGQQGGMQGGTQGGMQGNQKGGMQGGQQGGQQGNQKSGMR